MDIAYHLADVLQMELTYTGDKYTGAVTVGIADTPIQFKMQVMSWFKSPKTMGLLCSIKEDLMALCTVRMKEGVPSYYIFLLNKAQIRSVSLKPNDTYESAIDKVREGIVMSYVKNSNDTTWKEGLNNVKNMDRGTGDPREEDDGGNSKAVSRA